jgi:hypothetical protein
MNLFVIARNLPDPQRARVTLADVARIYPLLDPGTLTTFGSDSLYAAVLHTAHAAAAPRRYHAQRRGAFTLYDGCPVEPKGRFAAHDAFDLDHHWEHLHESLEGSFFAARLEGETLELLSDPLGKHQTFYWQDGEQLLVSNSVRLVSQLSGAKTTDTRGAAMFVGMGYVGGDRTLVEGVRIFPDAERWTLAAGETAPRRHAYFPLTELTRQPQRPLTPETTQRVAAALGDPLVQLSKTFGALECPITSGRDSRILVGLTLQRGLTAEYFTAGADHHPDVIFGKRIAQAFSLPHTQWWREDNVSGNWPRASQRVILQNDGMVTLAHIQNTATELPPLERLPVHLYGGGGEYARGKWLTEHFLLTPQTRDRVETYLFGKLNRNRGLVKPEVRAVIREHVRAQVGELLDAGFSLKDVPCAYFYHDYGRRWGGANSQQIRARRDVYGVYYTRPYIRTAFALPPVQRFSERLTYALTRHLLPELLAIPYASPWKPQATPSLYAHFALSLPGKLLSKVRRRVKPLRPGRSEQRQGWLEEQLPELRRHLDTPSSPTWELLDRAAFERLTAPETPPATRAAHSQGLFLALTLLEYERLRAA